VFGFLRHLQSLTSAQILERSAKLVKPYPQDLEESLCDEFVHFSELLNFQLKIVENERRSMMTETG